MMMRPMMRWFASFSALFLLVACDSRLGRGVPDDAGTGPDARDSTMLPPPGDGGTPFDSGGTTHPPDAGEPIARGTLRGEICGNLFDDDDDGMIDDGCDCAVGTERPCWLGPPHARGVGACRDGIQRCQSDGASATWTYCEDSVMPGREIIENGLDDDCDGTIDESDGICVARVNFEMTPADCANGRDDDCDTLRDCDDPGCAGMAHCPRGCEPRETLCWGGRDEDCDGQYDCDDSDCRDDTSCATGPCGRGQTPTYRERNLSPAWGGSSISAGDGQPIMPMTCETMRCPAGQVAVVFAGREPICVPPPPACPSGQDPTYVSSGVWRCEHPCELIIHYGSIYGGQNVCAPRPRISCPTGQSPTWVYEMRTWECRRTCDNTLYDRIRLDGQVVCVPC
jgi:hypothetical protein